MAHFHISCPCNLFKKEVFNVCIELLVKAGHTYYAYDYKEPYNHNSVANADAVLFIGIDWEEQIPKTRYFYNEIVLAHNLKIPIFKSYKRTVNYGNGYYGIYAANFNPNTYYLEARVSTSDYFRNVISGGKTSSDANTSYGKESKPKMSLKEYAEGPSRKESPKLIMIELRDKRLLFRR